MRRALVLLLASLTLAVAFGGLVSIAGEAPSPENAIARDLGPHHMLPNPDVYPRAPFVQADGWTGVPGTRSGGTRATGTDNVIVILIDFTDVAGSRQPSDVNDLMNDGAPGAASVRNYFQEVSYGIFGMQGTVTNWYRSSMRMSDYGADSSSSQFDDANGPIYRLVVEAVRLADATVDFSSFDRDGDGVVDHVIVAHAGDAQESNGNANLIWSHRWVVVDAEPGIPGDQRLTADGVQIYGYIMVSEFSPVGVYVHELGHDLGLPDLYDTDGSSEGVGEWDVMGSGSWNGVPRGTVPAHMGAWPKMKVGWINPITVTTPLLNQVIDQAETNSQAFKLPIRTGPTEEYFLVENRQRTGFDSALPGDGLLIWHIDESIQGNQDDNHRLVDLEEADGNDRPTQSTDAWASNRDGFGPESTPNSNSYLNQRTGWKVRNVGPSGTVMTADLSREVDDDLVVTEIRRPHAVRTGGPVSVEATVANRGAREQTGIVVNLTVYANVFEPGAVVCCGGKTIQSLAQGERNTLLWDVPVAAAGKYILEASVPLLLDEIPENNVLFAHFTAGTFAFLDNVEAGNLGWTTNAGPTDPASWMIVQDTNVSLSHSPTRAWQFAGNTGPPLCLPACPEWFLLTSPTIPVTPASPTYLYFWHRYDLSGRGIDLLNGTQETDRAFVNVSIGGTWRSLGMFRDVQLQWQPFFVDLSPFVTGPTNVTIELSASAKVLRTDGGWWVDDVAISNTPLTPGLVARAVNPTYTAEPGGLSVFRFKVVNVGDFDDEFGFALQPPTGWDAAVGHNLTRMQPHDVFTVRLRPDAEATLLLAFQVSLDAARGTRVTVPVTAASRANASVAVTFDTLTIIHDPFGLAGLEKYVFLFLIVFAAVIVVAVIIDAVKKQKGVYRRW